MIIGVDHGYGLMKTASFAFPAGITVYDHEPYSLRNTLKINDRYYVCGTNRQSLLRDKTENDNYYLLTLAALAKEVDLRSAAHEADVVLAAGLPLTSFGLYKQDFLNYLNRFPRDEPICFEFEGTPYTLRIKDVVLYPQGYSAVVDRIRQLKQEPSIIVCDIGSWTIDVMRLDNGFPNAEYNRSLELGMIRCISEISEQVRRNTGLAVTDAQIESVLYQEHCTLPTEITRIIVEYGKAYADRIVSTLLENGFDIKAVPVIFLGGGALFMKRFANHKAFCSAEFITDIHANAKGFEAIAKQARLDE